MSGGSLLVMLISFVTCFPQASGKNVRIAVLKSNTGLILLWLHKCSVCCYPLVSNAARSLTSQAIQWTMVLLAQRAAL